MKRLFLLLSAAFVLCLGTTRVFGIDEGPYLPLSGGGTMVDAPYIGLGGVNGRIASISVPCYAMVNINKGDVVVMATALTTTAMAVTETSTVGDVKAVGVAKDAILYGKIGQIVVYGIAIANVDNTVSLGQKLIPSDRTGFLCSVTNVAEGALTALSMTAIVGTAAQYRAAATPYQARVFIGKR